MKLEALWQLFLVRVRIFLREPEAVFWTFGFPVLIAVALGIAFRNREPEKIHVGLLAQEAPGDPEPPFKYDAAFDSRVVQMMFGALSQSATLDVTLVDETTAKQDLRTGKIALLVEPGFPVGFRYDPTRTESQVARLAVADAIDAAAKRPELWSSRETKVTEKGSRYIDFLIPGLIGMNIMSASMWGIGYSIVEARSRKLLKRLAATPMPRSHYLLAFILGHLLLVTSLAGFVVAFARVAFGVTVFGSVLSVLAVCILGGLSFAGLGVLASSRTDKVEVLSGINNLAMLPMFVASGVFFSSAHFPEAAQPFIQALPLTALNDALRAVYIDGKSIFTQGAPLGILAAWGSICFAAALRIFRWS